mmetsp:Transcript_25951/g.58206  ORF Transcript_25951/g.58206 Transcript_25951/m.58206 type:complete len:155 (-) Transcript_25951:211-675(-)
MMEDPCPGCPSWMIAVVFLTVWLAAWAAGEVTVAKDVLSAVGAGEVNFATFLTLVWLAAWTFGGIVACSAMWEFCARECFPERFNLEAEGPGEGRRILGGDGGGGEGERGRGGRRQDPNAGAGAGSGRAAAVHGGAGSPPLPFSVSDRARAPLV